MGAIQCITASRTGREADYPLVCSHPRLSLARTVIGVKSLMARESRDLAYKSERPAAVSPGATLVHDGRLSDGKQTEAGVAGGSPRLRRYRRG